jgi:hypothetical protein
MPNALVTGVEFFGYGGFDVAKLRAGRPDAQVIGVEFFGYGGFDVAKLRAGLPVREGQSFPSPEALHGMKPKIEEVVKLMTGRSATDVAGVDIGGNRYVIYIGLSGDSSKKFSYNPAPEGKSRLPEAAVSIYQQEVEAFVKAMQKGVVSEDDSQGYALFGDPEVRAKQVAMHEYAAEHEKEIHDVLRTSSDNNQREIAAQLLGYANQSVGQITDLIRASRDPDDGVRNNATRALAVLAKSDPKIAARIPSAGFIEMLNSGTWTDRNKGGFVLLWLSKAREPQMLEAMRSQALDSLVEMAKWRSTHAFVSRVLLGRIGGIDETRLQELAGADDQVEVIIAAARRKR